MQQELEPMLARPWLQRASSQRDHSSAAAREGIKNGCTYGSVSSLGGALGPVGGLGLAKRMGDLFGSGQSLVLQRRQPPQPLQAETLTLLHPIPKQRKAVKLLPRAQSAVSAQDSGVPSVDPGNSGKVHQDAQRRGVPGADMTHLEDVSQATTEPGLRGQHEDNQGRTSSAGARLLKRLVNSASLQRVPASSRGRDGRGTEAIHRARGPRLLLHVHDAASASVDVCEGEDKAAKTVEGGRGQAPICYPAYDLQGKVFDGNVLRAQRVRAVNKGMTFMWKYLRKNKFAALYAIGDDAPSIFFEIWYTAAHSQIRARARDLAVMLTSKLETRLLKRPADLTNLIAQRDEFFTFMFVLRSQVEMQVDSAALLAAADESWRRNDFAETARLYGYAAEDLPTVRTGPWLELLMRILIMEYNNLLLFKNRFPTSFGLKEAFLALRKVRLVSHTALDEGQYQDSFYLATHIVYAISAYSGIKTHEKDVPWLYRYVRRSLVYWMRQARAKLTDPEVYVDVDGVGEIADCLRGLGLSETTDRMVCTSTVWILQVQRADGSWPVWFNSSEASDKHDHYDKIHSTWVCTQALRDRDFKVNASAIRLWKSHMAKLLASTDFRNLQYKCTW